jgi:hypothetical protein
LGTCTSRTAMTVRKRPERSQSKPRELMRRILMSAIQNSCRCFHAWHTIVAMVLILAGCGGSGSPFAGARYPVKGKVLLADGKPLTSGRVVFISHAPPASAAADIGGDGAFEFKGPSGDGLPEATYKVHIAGAAPAGKASGKPAFASKYLDEEDSGLTATVTSDESKNLFEFKLETKDDEGPTSRSDRRR